VRSVARGERLTSKNRGCYGIKRLADGKGEATGERVPASSWLPSRR
jgi:hypothetical protein